jgi:hypothetical protein
MKVESMRVLGIMVLAAAQMMGMWVTCYAQPYEPEHVWHRCGYESSEYWFGRYMAGIGDVNGDNCEDFLLFDDSEGPRHVKLFYGGSPPDTTADLFFRNPYPFGYFGYNIENIGDVNGDGSEDFAILGGYTELNAYKVFVYFGGAILDTIPDVVLSESVLEDVFGSNIEGIGDVNGDGFDDVVVHASNYGNSRGKVWVYLGGSPMDSIADWQLEGVPQSHAFGREIAGKGDLNGDEYDDFAIYEWTGYPNVIQTNYYIFFGASQLDTMPNLIIEGEVYYPQIDIADPSALIVNLDGDQYSDLVIMAGRTMNAVVFHGGNPMDTDIDLILGGFDPNPSYYGMNVSQAGDVNGDGYDDIIAAQTSAYANGGMVVVYLGSPWMTGQPDMEWLGSGSPWFGCGTSLCDCGDINGDGVDDIMFGSYNYIFNTRGCVDIWAGDTAFVVSVPEEHHAPVPQSFRLLPPYPNPFNNALVIPFEVLRGIQESLSLKIYNILGREVVDLTSEAAQPTVNQSSVHYSVLWAGKDSEGRDVGSGVYLVELQWGLHRQVQKAVLLR